METFKELGLTQDQASKIMDVYGESTLEAVQAPMKAYEEMRTGWRNDVVKDPALGDGSGLKAEVKATLGRAIDSMGAKEAAAFREIMDMTGAGDHPAVIRGLYALAQLATEGRPVKAGGVSPEGQKQPGAPVSAAKALYPNLP